MNHTMKELPESQRPYEKCIREGTQALSDSELLAVILRNGTAGSSSLTLANEVLSSFEHSPYPGLLGILHCSLSDLTNIHGIGKVKAIQLKCIGELSKRIAAASARPSLSFHNPVTIAQYYMEQLRHEEQELLICMMLDTKNHLLGDEMIFKGTVNSSLANPREIFLSAVSYHAVGILLVHNHPSGDCTPSQADVDFTQRVKEAGEILGIPLLDHIIIGDCKYLSFREQGIF